METMVTRWFAHLNANPRGRDALVAGMWLLLGLAFLQVGAYPLWGAAALWTTTGSVFLWTLLALVALATQRSTRPLLVLGPGALAIATDRACGGGVVAGPVAADRVYVAC